MKLACLIWARSLLSHHSVHIKHDEYFEMDFLNIIKQHGSTCKEDAALFLGLCSGDPDYC